MTLLVDFVAADALASPPGLLRIADVIYLAARCDCPERWAGEALIRWPGCLLTAARAREDLCVIAVRGQAPVWLGVRERNLECPVLACAAVVYWRTVSGRPACAC